MPKTVSITATLDGIRYQGDNGFIIGNFSSIEQPKNGDSITIRKGFNALGSIINPQPGLNYKLTGSWTKHPKFGWQFKFSNYTPQKPQDEDAIFVYLVRVCKWVGPSTAEDMLDAFGDKTLEVLKDDPLKVAKCISGITLKKAERIQSDLLENEEQEAALVELTSLLSLPGLRKSLPMQLVEEYGSNAPDKLRENPYIITRFSGVGFMAADRLAMSGKFSIAPDSEFRIQAAIEFALKQALRQNGSTWVNFNALIGNVVNLISTEVDKIATQVEAMRDNSVLVIDNKWNLVTLRGVARDELFIAECVCAMVLLKKRIK